MKQDSVLVEPAADAEGVDVEMTEPSEPNNLRERDEDEEDFYHNAAKESVNDGWALWGANVTPVVEDDPYARRMAISQQKEETPHGTLPTQPQPEVSMSLPSRQARTPGFIEAVEESISLPPSGNPSLTRSAINATYAMSASLQPSYPSPPPQLSAAVQPAQASLGVGVSIEEAQAKARAIAARLASLNKLGASASLASPSPAPTMPLNSPVALPPVPGLDEPIPGLGMPSPSASSATASLQAQSAKEPVKPEDFAKNLMSKYGWSKGQGLGATSQGMLNPLALSGTSDASKKKGKGKQQHQAQQQEAIQPQARLQGANKVIGMATAKGRVVSDLKTEKDKQEREKYGEPSRVVCLSNMVAREEVDEELVSDVSAEARKLGILEECFVHIMPTYVPDDEAVRVFVMFTGLVGAWKAVKEFEGRFFGGRTVKAKFYDEMAFETGTLHL